MRKYATVSCNDPKRPTIRLNIGGKLLQVLKVQPTALNLRGPLGSEHNGEFTISKGTDLDITVIGATAQKKQVSVGEIRELESGSSYAVEVYAPSALVPGMIRDALTVEAMCSDGKVRTTVVQVTIDHQAPITMIPRGNVVFQRRDTARLGSPGAAPVRRDLQLMGTDPKTPFKITGMEILDAPEGLFKISQRTIQPGQRYVVSVEVTEQRQERSIRGQLKIKTDHPDMPEVAARIYAQFGASTPVPTPRPNPNAGRVQPRPGQNPVRLDSPGKKPAPQIKPVSPPKVKPAG